MKKLNDFVQLNEAGRGRPRKNRDEDMEQHPDLKDVMGVSAEDNGSEGLWEVDAPTEDDLMYEWNKDEITRNQRKIIKRFTDKRDFFVIGEAGWGKTSIITKVAKRFGYHVLTVYLDKAEATDLSGIPIPREDRKHNGSYQDNAMPSWAYVMQANPDKKFLLFFDEMNQAAPDVMNALMPIVLRKVIAGKKFKNFMVGSAGNFEHENEGGISELSKPLESRFKPIINWLSGGEEWKGAFRYLHKEWDDKLGKDLVDAFEENCEVFVNPREIEDAIFKSAYNQSQSDKKSLIPVESWLEDLEDLAVARPENLSRTQADALKQLADIVYEYVQQEKKEKSEDSGKKRRGRSKTDLNMMPESIRDGIRMGMENGYIYDEESGNEYGVSRENILDIIESDVVNAEMIEKYISMLENDPKHPIHFRFEKNEEFKDLYKDMDED